MWRPMHGFAASAVPCSSALEARAVERGDSRCTLTSTETAHRFYQSAGYRDDGAPTGKFGTSSGYPMSKEIVASR